MHTFFYSYEQYCYYYLKLLSRSIPALIKLLIIGDSLHLDGFVFELPGKEFGEDVTSFGEGVRRVLKCLSDNDPNGHHCMDRSTIGGNGWCFELCYIPIFVTTFAPCYPTNHSRYSFGTENGFILLQPMYSFLIHDIGTDTPITNWDNPTTARDKIRHAYKINGRPYYIRDTIRYPMSHDLVKPIVEGPGNIIEWWKKENEEKSEEESELLQNTNKENQSGDYQSHDGTRTDKHHHSQDDSNGEHDCVRQRNRTDEEDHDN